jgi:hypothetical protein
MVTIRADRPVLSSLSPDSMRAQPIRRLPHYVPEKMNSHEAEKCQALSPIKKPLRRDSAGEAVRVNGKAAELTA